MSSVVRSGGDSVTLIERLQTTAVEYAVGAPYGQPLVVGLLREAAARLAVLELRESDRQSAARRILEPNGELTEWPVSLSFADSRTLLSLIGRESDRQSSESRTQRHLRMHALCSCNPRLENWPYVHKEDCGWRLDCLESKGSGSASALEVEAAECRLWLAEQTAPLAIRLIDGCHSTPEGVAQAAKLHRRIFNAQEQWVMVAVLPLPDLNVSINEDAAAICADLLASATKPEASPSPENELQEVETGAAIRPRVEAFDPLDIAEEFIAQALIGAEWETRDSDGMEPCWVERGMSRNGNFERFTETPLSYLDACKIELLLAHLRTSAERSPSPDSSRPVSTDEEEGQ